MLTVDAAVVQEGPVFVVFVGDVGEKKNNKKKKITRKTKAECEKIIPGIATKSKEPTRAPVSQKKSIHPIPRNRKKYVENYVLKIYFAQKKTI